MIKQADYVLHTTTGQLLQCTLPSNAGDDWRTGRDCQPITWEKSTKALTIKLASADYEIVARDILPLRGGWKQLVISLSAAVSDVFRLEIILNSFLNYYSAVDLPVSRFLPPPSAKGALG